MSKIIERIKKQVKDIEFIEIDGSYMGHKIVVITKDNIENIKKEYSEEYKLLAEYGKCLLKVSNVDKVIYNWAKAKIWGTIKRISISKRTYTISEAMKVFLDHNQKDIYHPKDSMKLLEFAMSLADKKAKVLTFGMDDMSYEFLFDEKEKPSIYNLKTNMLPSAINNLFQLTVEAFYYLGTNFDKVQINSGYRTAYEQAGIMLGLSNLNAYGTTKYFIEYLKLIE